MVNKSGWRSTTKFSSPPAEVTCYCSADGCRHRRLVETTPNYWWPLSRPTYEGCPRYRNRNWPRTTMKPRSRRCSPSTQRSDFWLPKTPPPDDTSFKFAVATHRGGRINYIKVEKKIQCSRLTDQLSSNWMAPWKNRICSTTMKLRKSLIKPVTWRTTCNYIELFGS